MYRLIKAELTRRLSSLIFMSGIVFILIYNFMTIIKTTYGFNVDATHFLFQKTILLCIFLVVQITLQTSQELDGRTINNKLFLSYSKSDCFNAAIITGILEGTLLFLIDTISVVIMCKMEGYAIVIQNAGFIMNLFIISIIIATVAVITTVLTFLINYQKITIFIVMAITLLFLHFGSETVSVLLEPEQTTRFNIEGVLEDNPMYVDGSERLAHNVHLFSSPYAQICYTSHLLAEETTMKFDNSFVMKKVPYRLEFLLSDMVWSLLFYFGGLYLFKKRNLP